MQHPTKDTSVFREDQASDITSELASMSTSLNFSPSICSDQQNRPPIDEVKVLNVKPKYAHIRHLNGREVTIFRQDLAPYLLEANHSNEQNLPKPSSDDTEHDVYDQVPSEKNRSNTEREDEPAPPNAVVP